MSTLVNTFLIGAQKSGTTYLASLLKTSEQVCVSDPKEPHFFSRHFSDGLDSYHRFFKNMDAPIKLDASTTYSFLRQLDKKDDSPGLDPRIAKRIHDYNPQAKIIYIMRDPVERCKSRLRHNARYGHYKSGNISIMKEIKKDPMIELASRYSFQAQIYLQHFKPKNILFLKFDDLKAEPENTLKRTSDFLGIDTVNVPTSENTVEKHQSFVYPSGLGNVYRLVSRNKTVEFLLHSILPTKQIKSFVKMPANLSFSDADEARIYFEEEKQRVREVTGIAL